ncbi:hypothetical protein NQ015_10840 [Corynebacterium sp. 153RC1]|uniref:hypothetical protein n=1 Tax=unclassified Corynebacterium TaxID=2624378 RepID=UPI00211CA831|nr:MULTISPECIES: hypothetical protein [unclassified Corynebacterium]MCQ9352232.1 hypothetical protein [Corynebacterium sp. 209RC1]MCQ9355731.1 hypothetical protein [Corynebacterium sp. 1222RC1]MCQ9356515.1 hypothetical protein [Corynebacterium sp. 122RC1]MCQ9358617.1 hypothetical protein [Corynebacterium sp. 142RC1]MCQ9362240.1 hypothetical protein [Corynebacterium sp. 153RC1]
METKEKAPAATNSEEPQTKTSFTDQDSALIGVGQELDFGETLTPEHLAELRASVISDEVIAAAGIYSARTKDELPEDAQYLGKHGSGIYPVLVFPKKVASIGDSWQVKPQPGVIPPGDNGRSPKYISPGKGSASPCLSLVEHIAVTDDTDVVLIVEGTKQPLAVQSVLPEEWALYSFSGIHTWKTLHNGAYNPAFFGFSGHKVVIIPDADAATNPYVFDGATELGEYCVQVGAKEVAFVSVPGGGTTGMDDYLAHLPEDKRQGAVENLVKVATKKPAKRRPSGAAWGEARKGEAQQVARASGRTPLEIGKSVDKQELVEKIVDILVSSQGGKTLFVQDTLVVKAVYRGASVFIEPLDVYDLISATLEQVLLFDILGGGDVCIDALSTKFAEVVLRRLALRLPPLNGIRYVPVLLDDMTWLAHSGYHEETGLLLHLPAEFEGMQVPENPTAGDLAAAKEVLHDIFGEFAVRDEADFSRLLAGALTPFVRSAIDLAPMFVLTATGPGTGKGTAADVFSILSTGKTIDVKLPANSAEELRKATFAQLLAGKSMIFLDELEYINDPSLNAVLTGESISDRKLGESRDITVTNASTFYAAGNNVVVGGDTIRRVCMVFFQWNDPAVRAYERKFKHAEFPDYVRLQRGATVHALMTLVSAWAAAGQPVVPSYEDKPFATFTKWHRVLGGVLYHAGYADIMDGVDEFRGSYDPGVLSNRSFIAWLHETFGTATFKAYDAYKSLKTAPDGEQYLPADVGLMNDLSSRLLGKALTKLADVNLGFELVLRKGAVKHNTNTYYVEVVDGGGSDDSDPGDDGSSGGGPDEPDAPVTPEPVEAAESGETVVVFDLETGDAADLHMSESADYIRLATYSINGGEPVATTDIDGELIPLLTRADRIVGHNILQFDLPALRRYYGLDSDALVEAGKVHDTYVLALLADPPPSGEERKRKKYNLNAVAQRLHVGGKLLTGGESVLKRLAALYGGFDKIPVDNADYVKYALQDVRATAAVYAKLLPMTLDAVGADYLQREHLKMQRIATVAAHGVRIDTQVVEELLAEEGADPRKVDTSGGQYDGIMLAHAVLASNSFGDRYPHQE